MIDPALVSIRSAEAADAEAIAAVIRAAFEPYRGRLQPSPSALCETAEGVDTRLAAGHGLAADAGGRIVGCVLVTLKDPGELYVGRLAVLPEWQGRGLGGRLMHATQTFARERGCTAMSLGVRIALTGNIAFFERLGFRFLKEERHPGYAEPTFISMVKPLERRAP